jgi:hypothetical protein
MEETELEREIEHKIDERIAEKIETATKVYDKAIDFYKEQTQRVWGYNKLLAIAVFTATSLIWGILNFQSLPSMEQRISTELTNKLNEKFKDENIQKMIAGSVNKFTAEQVEKGYYELLELSVNIPQASSDIHAFRFLANVIKNPNYPYPKFMDLAKKSYEDARKRIRERNYDDDYDDPERCGIAADLLNQGKKNEILSQIKKQIQERSGFSARFCLVVLWAHKNISKEEKLAVSYEVLLNTSDPSAIYYICMKVENEGGANLKKNFLLETDEYIKWLEKYK